jgi:hypothetical protein
MKFILFLSVMSVVLPLTSFAQREHFSAQREKHIKPSFNPDTRTPDISNSIVNYLDAAALRKARLDYQQTINSTRRSASANKAMSSDAYLFLAPEERSFNIKK